MDSESIELLQQDVAKWEEAAKATEELLPLIPQSGRFALHARASYYRDNAQTMRNLLDDITKGAA